MADTVRRLPRSTAHASVCARTWADELRRLQPHDEITYAALHALTGVDPQERRDLLDTACALVQRDEGKIFDPIPGHGLVCLSESGKLGKGARRTHYVHRHLRKTGGMLGTVDQTQLTPLEKQQYLGQLTAIAAAALMTDPRTVHQLEGKPLHERIQIQPADYQHIFQGL